MDLILATTALIALLIAHLCYRDFAFGRRVRQMGGLRGEGWSWWAERGFDYEDRRLRRIR